MGILAKDFFTATEQDDIRQAILMAELDTSGEIRVHIENTCEGEVLDRAAQVFKQLGMTKTKLRNGVLVYLAIRNRKFAIIGDAGVHQRCGDAFWKALADEMSGHFRKSEFTAGLVHGIRKAGDLLAGHFPRQPDDVNELPDEIARD